MKLITHLLKSIFGFFAKVIYFSRTFLDKVSQSKLEAKKIESMAENQQVTEFKNLEQAINLSDKIINSWSQQSSWFEVILRQLLGINFLIKETEQQKNRLIEANEKFSRAKNIEASCWDNPDEGEALSKAKILYYNCYTLVKNHSFIQAANRCEQQIRKYQQFHNFVGQARDLISKWKFEESLRNLRNAEELFPTVSLQKEIESCLLQLELEKEFEITKKEVYKLAEEKKFQEALDNLEQVMINFPCPDGKELRAKIDQIIQAKKHFKEGLIAEKEGNLVKAKNEYKKALDFLPQLEECNIRLAILEVKSQKWQEAVSQVQFSVNERAAYIRGFAYAQESKWKQAEKEWNFISDIDNKSLCLMLVRWHRLVKIQEIQELVDTEKFEQAKLASESFLDLFGSDDLVRRNLDGHIQPTVNRLLEKSLWESEKWCEISKKMEENWLQHHNIQSLHNWAVASYYLTQMEPDKLFDLITPWFAALANIHQDPSLQNLSWVTSDKVNLQEVFLDLQQILDQLIDQVKDKNIEEYLRLLDHFRLEVTSLESMGSPPMSGVKLNNLFLPPSCYKHFISRLLDHSSYSIEKLYTGLPQESLYTDWGLAVTACLEGDVERAIQIKPTSNPKTDAEKYGYQFVSYHQGCHYLGRKCWRESVIPLKEAKPLIALSSEKSMSIDKLCQKQRREIETLPEHLEFGEFWHDLLQSNSSKLYLSEYKAEEVVERINKKITTHNQGLQELRKINSIYPDNPVVDDYINRIEFDLELEIVLQKMEAGDFIEALNIAKKSRHQKIKTSLVDISSRILKDISRQIESEKILDPQGRSVQAKRLLMCELVSFMYNLDSSTISYQTYRDYQNLRSQIIRSDYY